MIQAVEVAAHAKAAIADKGAVVVEHRHTRKLDRQSSAAIDRPVQRDAAPGLAGCKGILDVAGRIEAESLRDFTPAPAEAGGGAGADQIRELVGAKREATFAIHLPGEAQRVAP